jgi:hypothetical protein
MYEYVAMRKPVVIAETSAVRTHFDDSCFQFFTSGDPADLARALLDLYHDPDRALAMIEAASCRYRSYAWEAQSHVYCEAVAGSVPEYLPAPVPAVPQAASVHVPVVPQLARGLIASQERIAHVPSVVQSMEFSSMVAPIEEGGK